MPSLQVEDVTFDEKGRAWYQGVVVWAGIPDGKNEVSMTLEVAGGPHNGKHCYWHGYLSEKAWPYTLEKLQNALDYKGAGRAELFDFLPRQVGQEIKWSVTQEQYEGKWRLKVGGIYPVGQKMASRASFLEFCRSQGEPVTMPTPDADGPDSGAAGGAAGTATGELPF